MGVESRRASLFRVLEGNLIMSASDHDYCALPAQRLVPKTLTPTRFDFIAVCSCFKWCWLISTISLRQKNLFNR